MYRVLLILQPLLFLIGFNEPNSNNECWEEASVVLADCTNTSLSNDFVVVVHGGPKCGYCSKLMYDFKIAELPINCKIIFVVRDVSEEYIQRNKMDYRCCEVRLTTSKELPCGIKLIPTVKLYIKKGNSLKKLKTYKGYDNSIWNDILERCGSIK